MRYFILLIVVGIISAQVPTSGAQTWDPKFTNLATEWSAEYFYIYLQTYPLSGACYIKDSFLNKKMKITPFAQDATDLFYSYQAPSSPTFSPSPNLKALSTAITRTISAQKTSDLTGLIAGETQADFDKMNKDLASSGFPFKMNHANTKFYSAQAKYSKETATLKYWLHRLAVAKKLSYKEMFEKAKRVGSTLLRNGDIVYFTMIYSTSATAYHKDEALTQHFNLLKTPLGLEGVSSDDGNKKRFKLRDLIQREGHTCGEKKTKVRMVKYTRRRPAFTHYRILTEMKLMRRYPNVLYQWLKDDKEFQAKSPHAADIMNYLISAKKRKDVGSACVRRDMCAWSYAYSKAFKGFGDRADDGPVGDGLKEGSDGSLQSLPTLDTNYLDETYTLVMHQTWRAKLRYAKVYEIDHLETNDWGSYDLIVNVFLRDKNPRIWQLLLSDDGWGINNVAMATAKYNGKWRVTLFWYDSIKSDYCTTEAEKGVALLGDDQCLNGYFNFYQRRWHDYDYTKGVSRKPGQGETHADKPKPGDGPNDNPPKKPRNPAFRPPVMPGGPVIKPKIIKKKHPLPVKKATPKGTRVENDKKESASIVGRLAIRQVIDNH
jgi:hypothetical protein